MPRTLACLPALLLLAFAGPAAAQSTAPATKTDERVPAVRTEQLDGALKLTLVDLGPRFLDFYTAARDADPEARWALWERKYDFAAVPPTDEGRRIARQLLDAAWPRYAGALPVIRAGAKAMRPEPIGVLKELATLLELRGPFAMQVRTYVGGFEPNAFTMTANGMSTVSIPLEMDVAQRELILRHEMAHAVHLATAGLEGGWERSIAETVIQEGVATRAVEALLPGRAPREYIEHRDGWFAEISPHGEAILEAIDPVLEAKDNETVFRFTMGRGSSGLDREAYLAGWLVVGELMRQGRSLAEIARVPAKDMPALVRSTIASIRARSTGAPPGG